MVRLGTSTSSTPWQGGGAEKLWHDLQKHACVSALGALTGNQAVQAVQAGLAMLLSGWQVAANANSAGQTYPDQSLYPYDSVPAVVKRIQSGPAASRASGSGRRGT